MKGVRALEVRVLWYCTEFSEVGRDVVTKVVELLRSMGYRVEVSRRYRNRGNSGARVYIRCYVT